MSSNLDAIPSREHLFHALAEAAELEHCLMCTYLYAAFSLKTGVDEGLNAAQLEAVARWRRVILEIATEEMGHLVAVWNITAALGGPPRLGRSNFPLDLGYLPAGIVVRLAPFNAETLQHFIHLESPAELHEPDSAPFAPERTFVRGADGPRLTPMAMDYDTVGKFYDILGRSISRFVGELGEKVAFCGDPALQLTAAETYLPGTAKVICLKTALAAFAAIVTQGEGAKQHSENSHYQRFVQIRSEFETLRKLDPDFEPAFPAATNPVLRRPPKPEGRVWLENARAIATVDLANSAYGLMLRLLAYTYAVPVENPDKVLAIDIATGLMHALVPLAERAARLPAGPSNPQCHAGVSFIALRDSASLPPGASARRFFCERLDQFAAAAERLRETGDPRTQAAASILSGLARKAARGFNLSAPAVPAPAATEQTTMPPSQQETPPPTTSNQGGIEEIEGENLTLIYEGKRCIHSRFCVTWAPTVFLANVQGPWIHPDTIDAERLAEIAHVCPSGAIRYRRKDGRPDESAPPVNLVAVREGGPYAFRGDLKINGEAAGYRLTLCRCGASKNKPFCDGSHHDAGFAASGEPTTGKATDMLPVRNGLLQIDPQPNGPLQIRGNLEITSGTGRMVARVTSAKLCRCGGSQNKPYCDGTHAKNGFTAP